MNRLRSNKGWGIIFRSDDEYIWAGVVEPITLQPLADVAFWKHKQDADAYAQKYKNVFNLPEMSVVQKELPAPIPVGTLNMKYGVVVFESRVDTEGKLFRFIDYVDAEACRATHSSQAKLAYHVRLW